MVHAITKLTETHYEESLQLSEYSFQYKIPEEKRDNRRKQLDNQQVYCIFDRESLAAKLHLLSLEVWIGDWKVNMGGIAGVATYPEYRRRGYVKSLITHALKEMKDGGQVISMLHPFEISFYRKFGYELFAYFDKVRLNKKDLMPLNAVSGNIKRYNRDTFPEELKNVYEEYARQHKGMLNRSQDWWGERSISDLWVAIYYDDQQVPKGYISYEVKKEKMKVEEFVPLNSEARVGLWNFICQHDSMIEEAELVLNPNEPLTFLLENPRVKVERLPYFMSRIVDVEGFLKSYLQHIEYEGKLHLTIKDEFASWNNATFTIEKQQVKRSQTESGHGIELSINTFTALIFGVYSPKALTDMGLIQGETAGLAFLDDLLIDSTPFFYDFF
ncbi:GNAT family N-acetyltransferase [Rossellomorea aquimaris]|uniref:GNAT family N-acetyltransferase n=1 Tax=Rossellomorea aquimaris TaxID=189382 RepID=UPI001CD81915|nr:GNAT family N-acetyltransferase [Rossellomorea aquimaris]MCA1053383.1 GNAT family N-acetyltransferase [Rossellomorea aquimaris]